MEGERGREKGREREGERERENLGMEKEKLIMFLSKKRTMNDNNKTVSAYFISSTTK